MKDDGRLRELASAQHNLVGRWQGREMGIRADAWRRLAAGPHWELVAPRVLRLVGASPARGEVVAAAVLDAGPGVFIGYSSVAWWWGVPGFSPRPVHLIRLGQSARPTEAKIHRVRRIEPAWTTMLDGLPVVRPEWMILQLCGTEHPGRAERALDNAWNLRLLSGRSLIAFLAEYGEHGRNGTALLHQLVDARGVDYTPPASNLESRLRDILARRGLHPRLQVDSGGADWTGRVDFRFVDFRLIIEAQSERYHSALLDVEADDRRREQLEADGFTVVEVTDVEIWSDPDAVATKVERALEDLRRGIA